MRRAALASRAWSRHYRRGTPKSIHPNMILNYRFENKATLKD
jgi:hypothetical protein